MHEQKSTIYITLQVLYTVNMLNRFNATSLSDLQRIFFGLIFSLTRQRPRTGKVNVRATLRLFFKFSSLGVQKKKQKKKHVFFKALPSNMFLTLCLRKEEH